MAWRAARLLVGTDVNRPALFEFRKSITGDEHFNRTGATWYARDQPVLSKVRIMLCTVGGVTPK